jgi:hypothetical protein
VRSTHVSPASFVTCACLLGWALVGGGSGCDSGTDQPAKSPDPGGSAGAFTIGGGAGSDNVAVDCAPCLSAKCPAISGACAESERCLECVGMAPYPEIGCFNDDATNNVLDCTCSSCFDECEAPFCDLRPCVRCLAKHCEIEYDACSRKPSCAVCTLPDPPNSCGSEPLAVALYLCSIQDCKEECGTQVSP